MWFKIIFIFAMICLSATPITGNKLDFSWKGLTKEKFFRDQSGSVSNQVEKATELNLRGNLFDSFVDCSGKLDKLEVLDLSQNELKTFYLVCRDEDHLYKLNVSHNKLTFLNDTSVTDREIKLQILDMSHNIIQIITEKNFQHMVNLQSLFLDGNPIGNNINDNAFKNLGSLVQLHMCDISASIFPKDLFTPLRNLKHLTLAMNPLEVIPNLPKEIETLDLSKTNIIQLNIWDLPNLKGLALRSMQKLESLDFNQFKNQQRLTSLAIEDCSELKNITAVPPPTDDLLPQLIRISLKNCSIRQLDPDVQTVLQRASLLDLQYNPWKCDCGMKWILSLRSTVNYHDHLRCKSPPKLRYKRIFELPSDQFYCDGINYLALWLTMGIILGVASSVVTLTCLAKEPIKRWRTKSFGGDTVSYKNITANSNNDMEKILEQSDIADYL